LATIAGNEIPVASSSIPTRPPFYSLNAAAAATSSTMGKHTIHIIIMLINIVYKIQPFYASN